MTEQMRIADEELTTADITFLLDCLDTRMTIYASAGGSRNYQFEEKEARVREKLEMLKCRITRDGILAVGGLLGEGDGMGSQP